MLSRRSGRGSTLMTPLATLTSPPPSSTSTSSPRRPTSSSPVATPPTAVVLPPRPKVPLTGREVEEHAMRSTVAWMRRWESGDPTARPPPPLLSRDKREDGALARAYAACGEITADYAKTFYLGTKLMTPEKARAIWAIYVWCRRTDELVDGPNAPRMTPAALDRWEERLEAAWRGKPYDVLDAALSDTVAAFPVDIQPFRDMVRVSFLCVGGGIGSVGFLLSPSSPPPLPLLHFSSSSTSPPPPLLLLLQPKVLLSRAKMDKHLLCLVRRIGDDGPPSLFMQKSLDQPPAFFSKAMPTHFFTTHNLSSLATFASFLSSFVAGRPVWISSGSLSCFSGREEEKRAEEEKRSYFSTSFFCF